MGTAEPEELVANRGNHRQEQYSRSYAPFQGRAQQQRKHHHRHYYYRQQKCRAAPGVGCAELAYVFHSQGQSRFQGVDGHVLGAVVSEHPFYVPQHADQGDVSQQEGQPDHAFNDLAKQVRIQDRVERPGNHQWSYEE